MRVLITGVTGQLGREAAGEALRRGYQVFATGRTPQLSPEILKDVFSGGGESPVSSPGWEDTLRDSVFSHEGNRFSYVAMDLTDAGAVNDLFERTKPQAVIHCAAWTAVDEAEESENRRKVFAINEEATVHIARGCNQCGSSLVYISTDYVFDGSGTRPWSADNRCFSPLNVYGASKLAGELAVRRITDRHFIVRTSWVFGRGGHNFVDIMRRLGTSGKMVRVVGDQIGTPTYTVDLARLLCDMVETEKFGIYHASNEGGYISWHDFAVEIFRQCGYAPLPISISSEEYPSKAVRPKNSRLDKSCLTSAGFARLPSWQDALVRYLQDAATETMRSAVR